MPRAAKRVSLPRSSSREVLSASPVASRSTRSTPPTPTPPRHQSPSPRPPSKTGMLPSRPTARRPSFRPGTGSTARIPRVQRSTRSTSTARENGDHKERCGRVHRALVLARRHEDRLRRKLRDRHDQSRRLGRDLPDKSLRPQSLLLAPRAKDRLLPLQAGSPAIWHFHDERRRLRREARRRQRGL